MTQRLLYQFPISHYCEKARWCLDHKGLDYEVVNLLPGPHKPKLEKMTGRQTVPVLVDGRTAISDSPSIAEYLDLTYPDNPLLPADPALREQVLRLQKDFDYRGAMVRRWVYGQILDTSTLPDVFYKGYSPFKARLGKWMMPVFRQVLRHMYKIRPDKVAEAERAIHEGLDLVSATLQQHGGPYLVGSQLTLADITAASLFGPLLMPEGSPWQDNGNLPAPYLEQLARLQQHPACQWMLGIYRLHRQPG